MDHTCTLASGQTPKFDNFKGWKSNTSFLHYSICYILHLNLDEINAKLGCRANSCNLSSQSPSCMYFAVYASRWWTSPPLWFVWTARSTLTSPWGLHTVVDAQAASRERMPKRAREELVELTMRRRIKKDVLFPASLNPLSYWSFNKIVQTRNLFLSHLCIKLTVRSTPGCAFISQRNSYWINSSILNYHETWSFTVDVRPRVTKSTNPIYYLCCMASHFCIFRSLTMTSYPPSRKSSSGDVLVKAEIESRRVWL